MSLKALSRLKSCKPNTSAKKQLIFLHVATLKWCTVPFFFKSYGGNHMEQYVITSHPYS